MHRNTPMMFTSPRLFVNNLPYSATEEELREIFEESGWEVLDARVIYDRGTGLSKRFGFVELGSIQEARQAQKTLDGYMMREEKLDIYPAKDDPDPRGGRRRIP
jgi:nucleolin